MISDNARTWYIIAGCCLLLITIALAAPRPAAAQATSWYLMAPNEKIVSNPRVAIRMEHGPVMGPLKFITRGKFASRADCEPERRKLITEWRQLSVIKRGTWDRYGFTNPGVFVRCVRADDPQLRRAGAEAPPTMETFINRPSHR